MELAGSSCVGPVWRPKASVPPRLGAPLLPGLVADVAVPDPPQAAIRGPAAARPIPAAPRHSRSRRVRPEVRPGELISSAEDCHLISRAPPPARFPRRAAG